MKSTLTKGLAALAFASVFGLGACATATAPAFAEAPASQAAKAALTQQEVLAAQNAWGDALVRISTLYDNQGLEAARKEAEAVLDAAYGYNLGPVLFKPTLAAPPTTFRTTWDGALSYFVGNNPKFPGDSGFALKHWRSYKIENAAVFIEGDVAMTMGNVRITDRDGNVTVVDKTWGYKRGSDGKLRIVLHHSSLPYTAN